ncbi:hypothetical protein [Actinophytocola oryzae]|uniref:Uncharacterized protein n=1 Tax=Actinophytocola oryzae TaxID=502181 RepID=A0A4R7VUC0_9PSEU|nr:hypothetical protein [Actinophytocola oryzae]TDV53553.1 hypothetical protein CLV71_10421 [Actinophytocola oryzae]
MIEPSTFVPGEAPDGLRLWRLPDPPVSAAFGLAVDVSVLLEHLELTDLDFTLIDAVVGDVDRYLAAATDFVARRVAEDPEAFGVPELPEPLGLDLPEVTFSDSGWLVRFAEAPFPVADPDGLLVEFTGDTPVDVEGTSDADEID